MSEENNEKINYFNRIFPTILHIKIASFPDDLPLDHYPKYVELLHSAIRKASSVVVTNLSKDEIPGSIHDLFDDLSSFFKEIGYE